MATSEEYIMFVCERIDARFSVRYKKMFGEYMIYVNEKPVLLVCDNCTYVKILPQTQALLKDAETGVPYEGAKEHYLLDVENGELLNETVALLESITPVPKKRAKK